MTDTPPHQTTRSRWWEAWTSRDCAMAVTAVAWIIFALVLIGSLTGCMPSDPAEQKRQAEEIHQACTSPQRDASWLLNVLCVAVEG